MAELDKERTDEIRTSSKQNRKRVTLYYSWTGRKEKAMKLLRTSR